MSATSTHQYDHASFDAYLRENIPLANAMGVTVTALDESGLHLEAPLPPNVNDKGTAFGGSLSSLLMLSGWGLLWLLTKRDGMRCELVIHSGELRYRRPVTGRLNALCPLPSETDWSDFVKAFRSGKPARIALVPRILDADGQQAVRFACQFAALPATQPPGDQP